MHLLADLHLEHEHQQAQHDQHQRHIERAGLKGVDVRGGHIGRGRVAGHAGGDSDEADDAVGHGAADLVEHRAHGQGDGLVALAVLELTVFDGIGQGENGGHLDHRARHIEEHQRHEHHDHVVGEDTEHDVGDDHGGHATDIQVAARDALVEDRVQRRHDQAGDQRDDAALIADVLKLSEPAFIANL